jgi:two-component system, NarL family, response regulator DevR
MKPGKSVVRPVRVLIGDDHPMTRSGLVHVINHQPDMIVSGEAETAAQALAALEVNVPDLMLVDITLPVRAAWN